MSYTPTEWKPNDIATAARWNKLEQGVGELNMSYTPNTWADGQVPTAAKLNALEQAVASGGSSDFSTATVTIYVDPFKYGSSYAEVQAWISEGVLKSGYNFRSGNYFNFVLGAPFDLVIYKGSAEVLIQTDPTATIETTGSVIAEANEYGFLCTITGDCTITIS